MLIILLNTSTTQLDVVESKATGCHHTTHISDHVAKLIRSRCWFYGGRNTREPGEKPSKHGRDQQLCSHKFQVWEGGQVVSHPAINVSRLNVGLRVRGERQRANRIRHPCSATRAPPPACSATRVLHMHLEQVVQHLVLTTSKLACTVYTILLFRRNFASNACTSGNVIHDEGIQ